MPPSLEPPFQFEELLIQVRDGSRDALGALLEHYRPLLLHWLQSHRADPFQVRISDSDIVQQVLLAAIRDFPNFQGHSEEQVRGWLFTLLRHTYSNTVRHYGASKKRGGAREVQLEQTSVGEAALRSRDPDPLATAIHREQEARVTEALMSLSGSEREIFWWRFQEGLSFDDVARRLGCSAAEVRRQIIRTLQKLGLVLPVAS